MPKINVSIIYLIKLQVLYTILYFGINSSYSQEVLLKGVVKDKTQPLYNVNILAKPKTKNTNLSFAITNDKGEYRLALQKNKSYTVTVSFLGYNSYTFEVTLIKDDVRNITLSEATEELDEVIIIEEIPMIVKKDTIIYDVKAFTTGREYKLKNILNKLPGIEVEKNGEVTVNGKKVTKMLVEGSAFFGGNSKLAVENIPANAVDNVEVLDHYSEIGFLKNFTDNDEMAMNIKLKEDKNNFAFGDINGGLGEDTRYESHAGLFYYSPKTNMNFIGDLNDTGEKSFTLNDYINFEGGASKLTQKDGSSRKNSIQEYANLINNQPALESRNRFAGLNVSSDINAKLSVSGYGIYSNVDNTYRREITNEYFFEDFSYNEEVTSDHEEDNILGIGKLSIEYSPNFKEEIFGDIQVKIIDNQSLEERFTEINTLLTDFIAETENKGLEINQDFEWHKKINARHTISLVVNNVFGTTKPKQNWNTNRPILRSLIPLSQEERFNLGQSIDLMHHTFDIVAKHYWVLNSKNHLYTTFGNNFLNQEYETKDFQILSDNTINSFDDFGFGNDLNFLINDTYFGLHYKFKIKDLTVKTGGYLHYYNWKSKQEDVFSNQEFVFLPDIDVKLEISPSENLKFKYRFLNNFTDAPEYANKFLLFDYNKVVRGNEELEYEQYQNGSLRYSKFAMYNGLIINAKIDYKRRTRFIRNQVQIEEIDQFLTPILQNTPETIVSGVGNLRKKIKKFNFKLNTRLQYTTFQKNINNRNSEDERIDINVGSSVETRFKKWPNFELGYSMNFNKYNSVGVSTDFMTNEPYGNIQYAFLNNFTFTFDYKYTRFKNLETDITTTFDIANVSLLYKKNNSPFGFEISTSNLFNAEFRQNNSWSDFLISDTRDFIIPRILMLTLHYKI